MTIILIIYSALALFYFTFLLGILRGLHYLLKSNESRINGNKTESQQDHDKEFISVIIPFRNEAETILESINSISCQNFASDRFEVLYVDDNSTDNYLEVLSSVKLPSNIRILSVPNHYLEGAHKKRAVSFGIENSKGSIIVSTDCDCVHDKDWLRTLTEMYDDSTAMISGPVKFSDNNTLFGRLQKLEFAGLILAGAGLIGINRPVICSAASLSYRKSIFNKVGGFSDNMDLSSGDDELLMQKIAELPEWKVKFCLKKEAVAITGANRNVAGFLNQRKRWASKGLYYKDLSLIAALILIYLFYLSIPLQFISGFLFDQVFLLSGASILFLKTFIEYRILKTGTGLFYNKDIFTLLPLAELLQIPYIIIAGAAGAAGNFEWKGRQLKR